MRHFIGVPKVGPPRRRFVGDIAVSIMRGPKSPYDPSSDLIFAGMSPPPNTARKQIIDQCVKSLKDNGIWAKLDFLHVLAASSAPNAAINWILPGTYNATLLNSPAFTVDRGYTIAMTAAISTNFNTTNAGAKFALDNATIFGWANNNVAVDGGMFGNWQGGVVHINPRSTTNFATYSVQRGTSFENVASTDSYGLWSATRFSSTVINFNKSGAPYHTGSLPRDGYPSLDLNYGQMGGAAYWVGGQISIGGAGSRFGGFQEYMLFEALANYMAGVIGGTIMDPESVYLFDNMGGTPNVARRIAINNCIVALKSAGVWQKLDAFYAFAAYNASAARKNWKQPGTYNISEINAPTFTVDRGYTGATTKWLDSNFNASSSPGRKFLQDDASVFAWSLDNIDANGGLIGGATIAAGETILFPRTGNTYYWYTNNSTGGPFANTDAAGFWHDTRINNTLVNVYKNGVIWNATSTGSQAPANQNMLFLNRGGVAWTGRIALGGIGSQLNATEALALYNAANAYLTAVDAFTIYQLESEAIFSAFTTPPTAARKTLIDQCVIALKAAGVWDKLDALYAFAAADSQAALINWKAPGTFNATALNSPVFTADLGFTGNGTTQYLDCGFNASTAPSPKYTMNSACIFAHALTNIQHIGGVMADGAGMALITPRYTDDNFYLRTNNNVGNLSGASTNGIGFWSATRSGATASEAYKNGVSVDTDATAAATLPTTMYFLRYVATYWPGQVACGGFGQHLSAAEQTALYNALAAYMAGLATDRIAAAFTTPPSAARKTLIQNCVTSLMQSGVWDKLDALHVMAAADQQAACINWKTPGTYDVTLTNSPAFAADVGFTGDGSTKSIQSNFVPGTAGTQFSSNSATIFGWCNTAAAQANPFIGAGGQYHEIYARYTDNQAHGHVCQATTSAIIPSITTGVGFYCCSRTSSALTTHYKNGVSGATDTTAPVSLGVSIAYLRSNATFWPGQMSVGGHGSGLDNAQQLAFYNAIRTYLTGVGIP